MVVTLVSLAKWDGLGVESLLCSTSLVGSETYASVCPSVRLCRLHVYSDWFTRSSIDAASESYTFRAAVRGPTDTLLLVRERWQVMARIAEQVTTRA